MQCSSRRNRPLGRRVVAEVTSRTTLSHILPAPSGQCDYYFNLPHCHINCSTSRMGRSIRIIAGIQILKLQQIVNIEEMTCVYCIAFHYPTPSTALKGMRYDAVYVYKRLASLARTLFSAWTSSVSSDFLYSWFSGFASPSFSRSSSILLNSPQNLPLRTYRTG